MQQMKVAIVISITLEVSADVICLKDVFWRKVYP